jgi:uncharacterized protein (DUF302 family)
MVAINAAFERFTKNLEKILGHYPPDVEADMLSRPRVAEERLKAAEGTQGLMIFAVFDYGAALNIAGVQRRARQYLIGNPLTAITMTRHDIRAGLYAPLRVLVYEAEGGTVVVEYDQPSCQFGQFGRDEVTQVGVSLDSKLEGALAQAAELSQG